VRNRTYYIFCLFSIIFGVNSSAQSVDTIYRNSREIKIANTFTVEIQDRIFENVFTSQYKESERLFKEGKFIESLYRSKNFIGSDEINSSALFGRSSSVNSKAKFYELIALNQLALDNYIGVDSAIKELLKEDINYTPSDIAKDDLFNRIFASYSIQPTFSIGLIGNRITPRFHNTKSLSIHEDFDYSKSLEMSNSSYGFGALFYFHWKKISLGNESTWNTWKIERSISHFSGKYASELRETSRFFNSKFCLLRDFSRPLHFSRKNKIPVRLSLGPSYCIMKLRSSDGVITSLLPLYSFNSGNSSPIITDNPSITTRIDLAQTRNKVNNLIGLEAKLWFYMFKRYWMYSLSYQIALEEYTSEFLSLGNDILFNTYYVDSPTRLRCFQMSLAYCKPLRPRVSSPVKYD